MLASRITPKFVAYGLTGEILILVCLYLPSFFGWTHRLLLTEAVVMTVSGIVAFGIALLLSLEVAAEHRQSSLVRLAWQLFAINAGLSLLKRTIGSPFFDFFDSGFRTSPLRGLIDNLLIVPANFFLFAGLIAMWLAIHRMGLGFRIKWRDYLGMATITALFLTMLFYRENLSQGQSPFLLSRVLQPLGLALLGMISSLGIMLHRYAVQMGNGRLAQVMRWLMVYVLLRGILVLARSFYSPDLPLMLDSPSDLQQWTFDVLWQVVHWAAALATACRAELTVTAAEQLKRLREIKATAVPGLSLNKEAAQVRSVT